MKEFYILNFFKKMLPIIAATMFLMFGTVTTAKAQCVIDLNLVSTSNATCYNDGVIRVKVSGTDFGNINVTSLQFALVATGGGTSMDYNSDWTTVSEVPGTDIVKEYAKVVTGTYTVKLRFFCFNISDWIDDAVTLTNVVVGGSTDYPVRAEITTVRKSMNCQPTGQMRLSMGDGT
ncbi:MAG: hypothetical protein LBU83_04305, partial [Bacteroidales bacterium]|nr:hypothetical protein [Bacteroidales bacterium]